MSIEPINHNLCNGCGICVDTCPMDVIRLDTVASNRKELPPCQVACPARIDMRSYIYLLRNGLIREAMDCIREALPLPAVTGHVCPHPCESECARREVDDAVNINALERFIGDRLLSEKANPSRIIYAAKIAVIGSGPAGLSAAFYLSQMGYPVTVFESLPLIGGMLRYGIPEYRLPRNVLDAQIKYIEDIGVEFRTGSTVGKDITIQELKEKGYRAIFIAIGAQKDSKLDIQGIDLAGVFGGLEFLKQVNSGYTVKMGKKVVIVGGGNVAIDAARTALRLGARQVHIIYRRSEHEMAASKEQVNEAVSEGIQFSYLTAPNAFQGNNGKVTGVECVKTELGKPNSSGRRSALPIKGSEFHMAADMVVTAIGETVDFSFLVEELKTLMTSDGRLKADGNTYATDLPGIFAGGDMVSGPASVVEAFAAGKKVSASIDRYLKGESLKTGGGTRAGIVNNPPKSGIEKLKRQEITQLPPAQRVQNFQEVKIGMNKEATRLEAQRCMTCGSRAVVTYVDDCMLCDFCELDCPQNAIYVSPTKNIRPTVPWG